MFKSLFDSLIVSTPQLSATRILIHILASLLAGFIISLSYMYSDSRKKFSSNFAITVIVLPAVVSVVISLVGSDIARALSLGGVFSLVRFRSVPGDSRDIAYVFFTMVTGLAVGIDCYAIAFALAITISLVFAVLQRAGYARGKVDNKTLKITIPEDLDYQGVFDDLFDIYLDKYSVDSVRTTNMGTLFQITYDVLPKKNINEKKFIDELRTRNGNLNIMLGRHQQSELPPL